MNKQYVNSGADQNPWPAKMQYNFNIPSFSDFYCFVDIFIPYPYFKSNTREINSKMDINNLISFIINCKF